MNSELFLLLVFSLRCCFFMLKQLLMHYGCAVTFRRNIQNFPFIMFKLCFFVIKILKTLRYEILFRFHCS